jgi:hypothetical protein
MVLAEVGDRLEVGSQAPRQPHQFDIALRFALQAPARLHLVQVAVDVDLQQDCGVVRRSAGGRWLSTLKSERMQLQFVDEDVNDAHWVVLCDVVIQTLG